MQVLSKVSSCLRKSHKLPQTRQEFEIWEAEIFKRAGFETSLDYRSQLCSILMHISPTVDSMPLEHFIKAMRKLKTNFVAMDVINEIKEAAKKAQALEQEAQAKALEDTEPPVSPV